MPETPAQLLERVQDLAARIQAEKDAAARYRLLGQALYASERCTGGAPDDGACQYARGITQGLAARENPTKAGSILRDMLANLARAEMLAPSLDHAGPARLTAVVLLRAPGWPLGPGDPDAALAAARRAVGIEPGWPPNLIALAQAQAATGDAAAARGTFQRAKDAVPAVQAPEADRSLWLREAERGLEGG